MSPYLLLGLTSGALVLALTPLVARASRTLHLVDVPGGRKRHASSVPRTGGVAVVCAAAAAVLLVAWVVPELPNGGSWTALRPVLAAGGLVFVMGLTDDVRGLAPSTKLAIELLATVGVMWSGLLIERVTLLGATWDLGWLAWPVTACWIVGLSNAFNLIDGVDGLATGVAILAGAACTAVLIVRGHQAEAMLLAALVGGALGFLVYNFPPASIFLGDGGSLVFGFVLATAAIAGWQKGATALATGVPLLIFALPLADLGSTLVRRGLARPADGRSLAAALRQIVQPDRQHIHHHLLAMGWSSRRTVLVLCGVTAVLSLLAVATARVSAP